MEFMPVEGINFVKNSRVSSRTRDSKGFTPMVRWSAKRKNKNLFFFLAGQRMRIKIPGALARTYTALKCSFPT
jgi:hypothetical protein